jgi:Domain of unknown function (DUF1707)/Cell wall-active antibiotics response 4TMS YvqF
VTDSSSTDLRAADADRERVVAGLREQLVAGRLTLDEFSDRVDRANAARTLAELDELGRDLPLAAPAPTTRRKPTHWAVAIMGSVERKSRWRVSESPVAVACMGSVVLDLRRAEIGHPEITITAVALMGSVEVIVPEGVEVELTGLAVMGDKEENVADLPSLPGAPFVRVRAFALMGSVEVRSKPSRLRRDRQTKEEN